MLFEVNKNGRIATSGVGAIAVSASAVKHNAGRDAVFNATLNANIIKVCLNSFASSAYRKMLLTSPQTSGKSLMKIINNSGPRMLPCGIPLIT